MRTVTPTQPDDDAEIEVVPTDPSIESGEIVDRRSRVIRSSTPIPTLLPDEHTERTRLAQPRPAPPRRSWIGWAVATVVPAVAAAVLTFAQTSSPTAATDPTLPIQPTAELIGSTFDAQARAALVRVEAVATSPMVRNGIQTDAATLADMAKEQPGQFPVEHGETIEVFQVRNGTRSPMLRVPKDAAEITGPPAGQTQIERRDQGVVMVATAAVAPTNGVGGEIVMAIPVDLGPIKQRIDPRTLSATLNGLDAQIPLVVSPTKGVAVSLPVRTTVDLHTAAPLSISAVVATPPAVAGNSAIKAARIVSISIAGVMALVLVATLVRRRRT
jgi:hypothetical protein